jgi:hypothetical protein
MKCRDLQFLLPLYSDSVLTEKEQNLVETHLDSCPVCRQKLFDFNEIRNVFRAAARPAMPPAVGESVRAAVALRSGTSGAPMFSTVGDRRRWVDVWLMPFAVGSLSSVFLCFTLLWVIISNEIRPISSNGGSSQASNTTLLYPYPASLSTRTELTPFEYASSRAGYAHLSPSINPQGSLVALTRDLAGEIRDDEEVTVVADVYGNGSASITEVVEPSSDERAVSQLQQALGSGTSDPAFVPASFDQRIEPMRVVFKIQNVSVNTNLR